MNKFIGRKQELARLNNLLGQGIAKLIVVKGRRRIGKSRLLKEFGRCLNKVYIFSGLPPEPGITAVHQREEFARQLGVVFGLRGLKTEDWGDLFWHLAEQIKTGKTLVVLDEISWMALDDVTFLPKLKVAWDLYFTQNTNLIMALCGSISTWIERNILSSTGFLGRPSLVMTLDELPLQDCDEFWNAGEHISVQEKLIMLSVTGGVPRYLEEIDPKLPVEQNIKNLCFTPEGILFSEFEKIFSDLFGKEKELYRNVIENLAQGSLEAKSLFERLNLPGNGDDYGHLDNLTQAGFISCDMTWHIRSGKLAKLSKYRLSDNYCRFYLKYIFPNRYKISKNQFSEFNLTTLPEWSTIIGLQIENLILRNRHLIKNLLGISPIEVICDNPYFQRSSTKHAGCQIDYMIQTRFNTLYLCEIKFSKHPISMSVLAEIQDKIKRLAAPKNFSIRPVLIHCNQVSEQVEESGFFAKIINFADFLPIQR